MNRPQPYETIYAHDRRAHRHRCFYCGKIIDDGTPVLMWQHGPKVTKAMHLTHANTPSNDGGTMRDAAQRYSDAFARSFGYTV